MHEGQCAPAMRAGLYALCLPSRGLGPSGNNPSRQGATNATPEESVPPNACRRRCASARHLVFMHRSMRAVSHSTISSSKMFLILLMGGIALSRINWSIDCRALRVVCCGESTGVTGCAGLIVRGGDSGPVT